MKMTFKSTTFSEEILIVCTDSDGEVTELIERQDLMTFLYNLDSLVMDDELINKCINFDRKRKLTKII